jgi:aerobic carbon-monoxide dehydrogenase medium subunit
MIRTSLRYHAPNSLPEACQILAEAGGGGAVIGGGTIVVPRMTRGEQSVTDAVHIRRLNLAAIETGGLGVRVGAGVTYTDLLNAPAGDLPGLLVTMAGGITGGRQIRNQGTLGGSACYANPSSDVPACLVALDAMLHVQGIGGPREIRAADFFVDAFSTDLRLDEVLTHIHVPDRRARAGYAKLKLSESSWPIATATAVAQFGQDGSRSYRLVLGGVAAVPVEVDLESLVDRDGALALDAEDAGDLLHASVEEALLEPWADELAPAAYRRQVAAPVARRALNQLNKEIER